LTLLQGHFHFRSVNNLKALSTLGSNYHVRKRHSFIDDLESFFWVYLWIILSQDGPGHENARFDSCDLIHSWSNVEKEGTSLDTIKNLHLSARDQEDEGEFVIMPYFSKPPYVNLFNSLHLFFRRYKLARNKSAKSSEGETDYFPVIDTLYGEVLSFFDSAIDEVGKETSHQASSPPSASTPRPSTPKQASSPSSAPPSVNKHVSIPVLRSSPISVVPPTPHQPACRIQPERWAKRRHEEEPTLARKAKRVKLSPLPTRPQRGLSSKSRSQKAPTASIPTPIGTRRSERLRAIQAAMPAPSSAAPSSHRKRKALDSVGIELGLSVKKVVRRN